MVVMFGLVAMTGLVWLLSYSMACESEAEKRRLRMEVERTPPPHLTDFGARLQQAA